MFYCRNTMSFKIKKADILSSTEMLRVKQDHPEISECQINVVIALLQMENSLNQLPTGAGKTWPVVCFPHILDILRDTFGYNISVETRVLYVVPLVNLYHSLAKEMKALEIQFQVMNAVSSVEIDREAKVFTQQVFTPSTGHTHENLVRVQTGWRLTTPGLASGTKQLRYHALLRQLTCPTMSMK